LCKFALCSFALFAKFSEYAMLTMRLQNHSATYGFAPHRRHAVRVACHGEKPYYSADGKSQEEELNAKYGLPAGNKDCSGVGNYND
jgi:sulfonate dioxygenase